LEFCEVSKDFHLRLPGEQHARSGGSKLKIDKGSARDRSKVSRALASAATTSEKNRQQRHDTGVVDFSTDSCSLYGLE
jgi:hypothetical protein